MSAHFRRRGERCVAAFAEPEARVLRGIVSEIMTFVGDRDLPSPADPANPADTLAVLDRELDFVAESKPTPADPVLARLLPDAYRDDPEAAAAMRGLTEGSLRTGKIRAGQQLLSELPSHGGRVSLDADSAQAWLGALNDARLVLGTRLEVTDDIDLDAAVKSEPDPERSNALMVYAWLGWLQETLLEAIVRGR